MINIFFFTSLNSRILKFIRRTPAKDLVGVSTQCVYRFQDISSEIYFSQGTILMNTRQLSRSAQIYFCLIVCLCSQRVGVFGFVISIFSLLEVVKSKDDCLEETSKPNKGPLR